MADKNNIHIFRKLHWLSLIIGALSILLPLIFWSKIPEQIPMHYNGLGAIDRWEDKTSLILLFFIIAILMGVMSIAVYFVKSNMDSKYSSGYEKSEMSVIYPMLILMNLMIQCMFAYAMACSVTSRPLGILFLPICLVAVFAPIIYMIYKCGKIQTADKGRKAAYKASEKAEQGTASYRTAVDWWLGILLGGTEIYMIYLAVSPIISQGQVSWSMIMIAVGTSIILVPLFGIRYVMYSDHLLVSMNLYGKVRIRYEDIRSVKETHNPLSSAAMSLRRIQIDYVENGVHRMILISPVRKKTFLGELEKRRRKDEAVE